MGGQIGNDYTHFSSYKHRENTACKQSSKHITEVYFFLSPDKLLYVVGIRGDMEGDWEYPRGLCTTIGCMIAVADSGNHRVQVLFLLYV